MALLLLSSSPLRAQTIDPRPWAFETYGRALSIARTPTTIYLAGNFQSVGPLTGQGVPVNTTDGAPLASYPKVVGSIEVVIADGRGGWYIGGSFSRVGETSRRNLAHILANGRVSSWAPDPDLTVWALLLDRDTLYVGGEFTAIAGAVRHRAAAIDARNGRLTRWNPDANEVVRAIVADSTRLYLGGGFWSVGGLIRRNLAAVDRVDGQPTAWNPESDAGVYTLAVRGNEVYAGGLFRHVGGQPRDFLVVLDRESGAVLPWDWPIARISGCDHCDGGPFVASLVVSGERLYVGGSYTHIGGVPRTGLAAVDLTSHTVATWDPQLADTPPEPYCFALAVQGRTVYVGGRFEGMAGEPRRYVGALDAETGEALPWYPRPTSDVHALAATEHAVYMGGLFSSVWSWERRNCLAALDAATGQLLPWNPDPNGSVPVMHVSGNTVYVSGAFSRVGGQPRAGIAALDGTTGLATAWNPGVVGFTSQPVWAMEMLRGVLYVGGLFDAIGGESRRWLAAVDSATGRVTAWNPGVNDMVQAMALKGDTLFLGGWFTSVGGRVRSFLAAVDTSGAVLNWQPELDDIVQTLAVADERVFIGGFFTHAGGQERAYLAAVEAASGEVSDWVANATPQVRCLSAANHVLYAGGWFTSVGGVSRAGLAAIDTRTGTVLAWDPRLDPGVVSALHASDHGVHLGGLFERIGGESRPGFAIASPAVHPDSGGAVPPRELVLAQSTPNPASGDAVVQFTLPSDGLADLTIYDLQGRIVSRPLARAWLAAGPHQVALATSALRPGCYVYRLDAGGRSATRKMVVVK